jgi:hypothetical protein
MIIYFECPFQVLNFYGPSHQEQDLQHFRASGIVQRRNHRRRRRPGYPDVHRGARYDSSRN